MVIFTFLTVAIIAATLRTFLRIRRSEGLAIDDGFLLLALITLVASEAVVYPARDQLYFQVNFTPELNEPDADDPRRILYYEKLISAAGFLVWTSIFAVKFSFAFFFRKLIRRVRSIEIWWWLIIFILVASACTCTILEFMICADFSLAFMCE